MPFFYRQTNNSSPVFFDRLNNNFIRIARTAGVPMLFAVLAISFHPTLRAATAPTPYTATVAWDRSPDNSVTGYRVYYGTKSRQYTNSVVAGNTMTATIAGLASGVAYYFAVTAYDASGAESDFSNEASVVPGRPQARLRVTPANQAVLTVTGLVGHTYDVLASTNLVTWTVIGNTTLDASATQDFTDPDAAAFPKRFYRTRETLTTETSTAPADATVQIRTRTARQTLLTVTGLPGHTYDVQVSPDLTNWTTLVRVPLGTSGTDDILDRVTPYYETRYYRAPHVAP